MSRSVSHLKKFAYLRFLKWVMSKRVLRIPWVHEYDTSRCMIKVYDEIANQKMNLNLIISRTSQIWRKPTDRIGNIFVYILWLYCNLFWLYLYYSVHILYDCCTGIHIEGSTQFHGMAIMEKLLRFSFPLPQPWPVYLLFSSIFSMDAGNEDHLTSYYPSSTWS